MMNRFRKLVCFSIFALSTTLLSAQLTDFNRVVLPVDSKAKDFKEYLVQLAWQNNPDNQVYAIEIENAKDQLVVTKKDWMKDVQLTSNLNEANLKPLFESDAPTTTNTKTTTIINNGAPTVTRTTVDAITAGADNVFFPRYNLGINVNLGTVLTQKPKNRIREREIKMAEHQLNQRKLRTRAETLERYENLIAANEIYKTRVQIEQDIKANFVLIGSMYKTDEKTFEEYNESSSAYHGAVESRIKAESERRVALYRLEEIIGVTWDLVKHSGKEPNM
jgi:outer membrane protein TolC